MSQCAILKNSGVNRNKTTNGSGADGKSNKSHGDRLFDPSVDMMVDDYDDERTLEEEEALAAGEAQDPHAELSNLQREGDMPLSELLKLYGLDGSPQTVSGGTGTEVENGSNCDINDPSMNMEQLNNERLTGSVGTDTSSGGATDIETIDSDRQSIRDKPHLKPQSALCQLYEPLSDTPETVSRTHSEVDIEEEEDDYDYSPDEDEWKKKTIMVGSDYQAAIPEGLCCYDDVLPYENDDKLLWDPTPLTPKQVEEYLKQVRAKKKRGPGVYALPVGKHLKDDEQALFLLLQCGHNIDEALRRRRINAITSAETMSLWSEEECRNFENGLRSYGKDFHLIQQNKVRTRSVGELVQFYYLWKKTERHDVFANKTRLEKKKYTLHPGITDFMDRFLDEQDQMSNQERSTSPYVGFGSGATNTNDTKTKSNQLNNDTKSSIDRSNHLNNTDY
ncbi:mesoderm induction early response protein 1 isoform X2 [Chrysoperla carnea]|uniref:mesoderm induction early response protein 1 isoform X2 n=1 Tax=Chrysoperla carnea TaxID=189513 RepID=UPI001D097E9F|nr:mesoderm induction early response protein 1 isoform X2 [Chrysoperla carnea]